jgi:uncharacterized protein
VATEWDPHKAHLNHKKHGVRFSDAVTALEDERALTVRDSSDDDEDRWVTLGLDALGRLLVVVYCWRGQHIRLVSARKASASEQAQYAEGS